MLGFFFALIAIAAAVFALGAPAYRTEIRDFVAQTFPDLPDEAKATVAMMTGVDSERMEITTEALDARIDSLSETLRSLLAIENVSPAQVQEVLLRDQTTARIEDLAAKAEDLSSRIEALSRSMDDRLAGASADLSKQIAEVGARVDTAMSEVSSVEQRVTASAEAVVTQARQDVEAQLEAARQEVANSLDAARADLAAASERVGVIEQGLTDTGARIDALSVQADTAEALSATAAEERAATKQQVSEIAGQVEEVAGRVGSLGSSLETVGALAAANEKRVGDVGGAVDAIVLSVKDLADVVDTMENRRASMETPLIGLSVLRRALDRTAPFQNELGLMREMFGSTVIPDAGAMAVLNEYSRNGVRTVGELRRDFRFVAVQSGRLVSRIESWSEQVRGWFEYVFGIDAAPEAGRSGRISTALASIDDALEAGQLDIAIEQAMQIAATSDNELLAGWTAEVRQRRDVELAYDSIERTVYRSIGQ